VHVRLLLATVKHWCVIEKKTLQSLICSNPTVYHPAYLAGVFFRLRVYPLAGDFADKPSPLTMTDDCRCHDSRLLSSSDFDLEQASSSVRTDSIFRSSDVARLTLLETKNPCIYQLV